MVDNSHTETGGCIQSQYQPSDDDIVFIAEAIAKKSVADRVWPKWVPGIFIGPDFGFHTRRVGRLIVPFLGVRQGFKLAKLAETDPQAFDLASYIGGTQMLMATKQGFPMPDSGIAIFAAAVLRGEISRPKSGAKQKGRIGPILLGQYALCRYLQGRFDLPIRKNEASAKTDLTIAFVVANAFTKAGMPTTEQRVADLFYSNSYDDIRDLYRHIEPLLPRN